MTRGNGNEICENSGFSLIEIMVTVGLLLMTLVFAIHVLNEVAKKQREISQKESVSLAVDNFLESMRVAIGYDDPLRLSLLNGTFSPNFTLKDGRTGENIACTFRKDSVLEETALVICRTDAEVTVSRTIIIPEVVPVPGAVLTPAPSDIIRLHVSTAPTPITK